MFYKKFRFLFYDNKNITRPLYINILVAFLFLLIVFSINIYFFNLTESVTEPTSATVSVIKPYSATVTEAATVTKPIDFSRFGQFGDFMGGILNPIFMFLTLIALIITIVLQRKEFKLARKEYSKTSTALNTQSIENTFFNTINLHYRIVENLKIDLSDFGDRFLTLKEKSTDYFEHPFSKNYSGIKVFDEIINKIFERAKTPKQSEEFYKILQDEYNYILGHYFRNLYQALKLIDKNEYLKDADKKKYTSILRAQLSSSELALLFLNCLENICDTGQFKNLLIKFEMLEHLNIELKNNYYILSGKVKVSEAMVLQYYKKINEFKLDLEKNVGGAYGKNSGVSSALIKYKNRELDRQGKKERYIR